MLGLETIQWEQPIVSDFLLDFFYSLSYSRQRGITMITEIKERGGTLQHPSSSPSSMQKGNIQLKSYMGK